MGVNFEFNTEIKSLQISNDKIASVSTDSGEIKADCYSVSLGSYSTKILSKIGIEIPIYPVKGYSITLPVLSNEDAPQSTIMDEKNKIAITRLGDRIRVAGMAHLTDFDKNLRTKSLDSLMSGLDLDYFPKVMSLLKRLIFGQVFDPALLMALPLLALLPSITYFSTRVTELLDGQCPLVLANC